MSTCHLSLIKAFCCLMCIEYNNKYSWPNMRVFFVISHTSIFPDIFLGVKPKDHALLNWAQSSSSPGPTYVKGTERPSPSGCRPKREKPRDSINQSSRCNKQEDLLTIAQPGASGLQGGRAPRTIPASFYGQKNTTLAYQIQVTTWLDITFHFYHISVRVNLRT